MTTFAFPAPFGLEPFFEPFLQAAAMHVPQQYAHHKHAHQQQQQRRDQNQQQQRKPAAPEQPKAAPAPAKPALKAPSPAPSAAAVVVPPCNIFETESAYWIQVDVPGASDPEVVAHEGKIVVKAPLAAPHGLPSDARPLRRERPRAARYERTFALPESGVDADAIEARLDAGVLTIVVPKVQPQAPAPKRIRVVKVGGGAAAAEPAAAAVSPAAPSAPVKNNAKTVRLAVPDRDDDEGSVEDASEDAHDDDARMQA